jgi:hypothetical protein
MTPAKPEAFCFAGRALMMGVIPSGPANSAWTGPRQYSPSHDKDQPDVEAAC